MKKKGKFVSMYTKSLDYILWDWVYLFLSQFSHLSYHIPISQNQDKGWSKFMKSEHNVYTAKHIKPNAHDQGIGTHINALTVVCNDVQLHGGCSDIAMSDLSDVRGDRGCSLSLHRLRERWGRPWMVWQLITRLKHVDRRHFQFT